MVFAKICDEALKGNWYLLYLADIIVWFAVGYICGGGMIR
tara:strand:+ start:1535 stop:1654 length:120 start_codon:yes stop_codon:yes gene_type:complete